MALVLSDAYAAWRIAEGRRDEEDLWGRLGVPSPDAFEQQLAQQEAEDLAGPTEQPDEAALAVRGGGFGRGFAGAPGVGVLSRPDDDTGGLVEPEIRGTSLAVPWDNPALADIEDLPSPEVLGLEVPPDLQEGPGEPMRPERPVGGLVQVPQNRAEEPAFQRMQAPEPSEVMHTPASRARMGLEPESPEEIAPSVTDLASAYKAPLRPSQPDSGGLWPGPSIDLSGAAAVLGALSEAAQLPRLAMLGGGDPERGRAIDEQARQILMGAIDSELAAGNIDQAEARLQRNRAELALMVVQAVSDPMNIIGVGGAAEAATAKAGRVLLTPFERQVALNAMRAPGPRDAALDVAIQAVAELRHITAPGADVAPIGADISTVRGVTDVVSRLGADVSAARAAQSIRQAPVDVGVVGAAARRVLATRERVGQAGRQLESYGGFGDPIMAEVPEQVAEEIAPTTRRMFHGTGAAFESVDPGKIGGHENLFGPGYYLTSDPRVASGYAQARGPQLEDDALERLQARSKELRTSAAAGDEGAAWRLKNVEDRIKDELERRVSGPNIRPIDVPDSLNLFDVDRQVPAAEVRQIAEALPEKQRRVFVSEIVLAGDFPTYGEDVYSALSRSLAPPGKAALGSNAYLEGPSAANKILEQVGYDGIQYLGGKRVPMLDDAGKAIEHTAMVIFPKSLGKITNLGTGAGGALVPVMPDLAGGAAGAALAGGTAGEDVSAEERAGRTLVGFGLGFFGRKVAGRGGLEEVVRRNVGSGRVGDPRAAAGLINETQMFRRAHQGPPLRERITTTLQQLEKQIADEWAPLNRISPLVEREAALYRGAHGPIGLRMEQARPVLDIVWDNETTYDGFNNFVKLQRDVEVANLPRFGGRGREASGGIHSAADAHARLVELELQLGPDRWRQVQDADLIRQRVLNELLYDKVAAGMVDPDFAAIMRYSAQPHYNPVRMQEVADAWAADASSRVGRIAQRSNTIRRLSETGHVEDTLPPIETFLTALREGEHAIQKTMLTREVVDALAATGEAVKVPNRQLTRGVIVEPTEVAGEVGRVATHRLWEPPGAVPVWRHGVQEWWEVPPDIEKILKGLDGESLNGVLRVVQAVNNVTRAGVTSLSPAFTPVNILADLVSTFVTEGAQTAKRIPVGWWRAARYFAGRNEPLVESYIREGALGAGFWSNSADDAIREMQRASSAASVRQIARTGGRIIRNPGELLRLFTPAELAREMGLDLTAGAVGAGLAAAVIPEDDPNRAAKIAALGLVSGSGRRAVQRVNEIVELGPRLATFEQRQLGGASARDAALASRRVTVDFSRAGQFIRTANAAVLFLNAATQGSLQPFRILRGRIGTGSGGAAVRVSTLAALTAAAYSWNHRDEDTARAYADVPQWEKDSYLVMTGWGHEQKPDGSYSRINRLSIPLREWSMFTAPLSHALDIAHGERQFEVGHDVWDIVKGIAPGVPRGETSLIGPKALSVPLEVAANYNPLTGGRITPRELEGLPKSEQMTERTSSFAKSQAGRAIGGRLGISPTQMDYTLRQIGGSLASTVLDASDVLAGKETKGVPVASGLLRGVLRTSGGQRREDLYDELDRRYDAKIGDLTAQVRATSEYQAATEDRQKTLMRAANLGLRNTLADKLNIEPSVRDLGAPPKYPGVTDSAEERGIDRDITALRAYNDKRGPKPTDAQIANARKYLRTLREAYVRTEYRTWERRIEAENAKAHRLGVEAAAP